MTVKVPITPEMWTEAMRIGSARYKSKVNPWQNIRVSDDDDVFVNALGVIGEMATGLELGLCVDRRVLAHGDDGSDLQLLNGLLSLQVKTTKYFGDRRPYYLPLLESDRNGLKADVYVHAIAHMDNPLNRWIDLVGYTTKFCFCFYGERVRLRAVRWGIADGLLRPFDELRGLVMAAK